MRITRPVRLIPAFLAILLIGAFAPTVAASAAVPVCADLQIGALSVNPATPIAGQQATITVPVYNAGTCTAFGATVQWKKTPYAASGPSKQINSIDAGQTINVLLPFTFPKAGNFESTARVDTKNVVTETNEKNNTQLLPVTVLRATTDLSITSITTIPDHPVQGRNATIQVTVNNSGNTAAGPFRLKVVPRQFAAAINQQESGLAAGATTTYSFNYTYQKAGKVTIKATVDSTKAVKETNEKNNNFSQPVTVDPPKPDLTIDSASVATGVPGTTSTATIVVHNIGNSDAGSFILSWTPGLGLGPVSTQISGLAAGATTTVNLDYVFANAGHYDGVVTADSTNVVSEIFENNNTAPTSVDISTNTIDLVITGETLTGVGQGSQNVPVGTIVGTPTQGEPLHVDIAVTNQGNTTSGPFLVDWNPDANYVTSGSLQTVTKEVTDLGPGQTTHVTFDFTYTAFGNFSTLATLDPRNTVTETNEANNQNIVPITVAPGDVNLEVTGFSVNPSSIKQFSSATASITVKNTGTYPAGVFAVQWHAVSTGGASCTNFVSSGLSPGESTTLTCNGFFFQAKGNYTSLAVVDPFNMVVEPGAGESDNTRTFGITILPFK
jgi:subtilase family serine protease